MDFVAPWLGGEVGAHWLVGVAGLAFLVAVIVGMVTRSKRQALGDPEPPPSVGADKGLSTGDFAPGMEHVLGGGTPSLGPPPPAATLEPDDGHMLHVDPDED